MSDMGNIDSHWKFSGCLALKIRGVAVFIITPRETVMRLPLHEYSKWGMTSRDMNCD